MIRQLVGMFILSILVGLILQSHEITMLGSTNSNPIIVSTCYILGYAIFLLTLGILGGVIPRIIYWILKKKKSPEFVSSAWSVWIIFVIVLAINQTMQYNNYAKNSIPQTTVTNTSIAQNVYDKVVNSIYMVKNWDKNDALIDRGSAVAVTKHFLVTNCHVIADGDHFTVSINGKEYIGNLYAQHQDVCIIEIPKMTFCIFTCDCERCWLVFFIGSNIAASIISDGYARLIF